MGLAILTTNRAIVLQRNTYLLSSTLLLPSLKDSQKQKVVEICPAKDPYLQLKIIINIKDTNSNWEQYYKLIKKAKLLESREGFSLVGKKGGDNILPGLKKEKAKGDKILLGAKIEKKKLSLLLKKEKVFFIPPLVLKYSIVIISLDKERPILMKKKLKLTVIP